MSRRPSNSGTTRSNFDLDPTETRIPCFQDGPASSEQGENERIEIRMLASRDRFRECIPEEIPGR